VLFARVFVIQNRKHDLLFNKMNQNATTNKQKRNKRTREAPVSVCMPRAQKRTWNTPLNSSMTSRKMSHTWPGGLQKAPQPSGTSTSTCAPTCCAAAKKL
jgi:poly(3-hydroxybutyrate) depolymerase